MGVTYGTKIVTDSLHYMVDAANVKSYAGSGTLWNDLSGNGYTTTLSNGPTYSSDNKGILTFDGGDDYAEANSRTIVPDTGAFSVGMVFMLTGAGGRGGIFNRQEGSDYKGFSFGQGGNNDWSVSVGKFTDNSASQVTFTYPTMNTWYYDFAVFNGDRTTVGYRNGEFVNSSTSQNAPGNLSSDGVRQYFRIASRLDGAWLPIKIALISVYHKELTAAEVKQNYEAHRARFGVY